MEKPPTTDRTAVPSKLKQWKYHYLTSAFGTCGFQVFCNFLSFIFGYCFLNRFWCTFNQFFSFFQAKTSDCTNFFNDGNFIATELCKDDIEFGFLAASEDHRLHHRQVLLQLQQLVQQH